MNGFNNKLLLLLMPFSFSLHSLLKGLSTGYLKTTVWRRATLAQSQTLVCPKGASVVLSPGLQTTKPISSRETFIGATMR